MDKIHVLFVCLGNICRSPMAEGMFRHLVEQRGLADRFFIDSAGTSGFHEGEKADLRMRRTARGHGVELTSLSRPVRTADFSQFHYILAMDGHNLRDLRNMAEAAGSAGSQLQKMREYDPETQGGDVPDPYYGGDDGFEEVFEILERSCNALLDHILAQHPA
jgi:protein-tyrosine phosphatase